MQGRARIAAVVGLLLLGLIGLFPPLRRPADIPAGASGMLGSRTFLLSQEHTYSTTLGGQQIGKAGAEIDGGRLFAETLVIVAVAGVAFIALQRAEGRPAQPAPPADRHRGWT
jgi:hypothetical protein